MSKKHHNRKLKTDNDTDYVFEYFMHEGKFNTQLQEKWDAEMEKKVGEYNNQPKLEHRVKTEDVGAFSSAEEKELPSNSSEKGSRRAEFASDKSESFGSESVSARSPYGAKISGLNGNGFGKFNGSNGAPQYTQPPQYTQHTQYTQPQQSPNQIVESTGPETAEERRARAIDEYWKLQDLVEKYGVQLTKHYTPNDDPDEMRIEYDLQKSRRHKTNQVKFYKNVLLNIVCGVEFLNDRYNPFEFKLKDWSKTVAADMDNYTEVLEEIYEKYKDRGGNMAPEVKLLFMIIMSGVTFHLSQALFGSGGLEKTISNNPNIITQLLGPLMNGSGLKGLTGGLSGSSEPVPRNNKKLLEVIRGHQNRTVSESAYTTEKTTEKTTEHSDTDREKLQNERIAIEKKLRLDAERKMAAMEARMKDQNDTIMAQLDQIRAQGQLNQSNQLNKPTQLNQYIPIASPKKGSSPVNRVLSGLSQKPRFETNPILSIQVESSDDDIFTNELNDTSLSPPNKLNKPVKSIKSIKPKKQDYDEIIDSLEKSMDISLDDIESPKYVKPTTSVSKPRNRSATRSTTLTATRGKKSGNSEATPTKKPVIIKL